MKVLLSLWTETAVHQKVPHYILVAAGIPGIGEPSSVKRPASGVQSGIAVALTGAG
jgi:hypothetical protein